MVSKKTLAICVFQDPPVATRSTTNPGKHVIMQHRKSWSCYQKWQECI